MTEPEIRTATESELAALGELIAAQQADGRSHIAYLGTEAASIAEDLASLEPLGAAGILMAVSGGAVVGALAAEWDREPPRVWWHGPFVAAGDWDAVADRLLAAGRALLPDLVTEEELGPDDRNTRVAALARRHGFHAEEASVVLARRLDRDESGWADGAGANAAITRLDALPDRTRQAVAALHDRLFPTAHSPGHRLDEGQDRFVLVAVADAGPGVAGYVAAERQSDGTGYIDFVGVDEAARGAGVGRALVERACSELSRRYGCRTAHLTVRESLEGARRLYERCGFGEERVLRAWRRGFTVAAG